MGLLNQKQPKQKAPAQEQAKYAIIVKQVIGFMSQPEQVEMLKQMVDQMGAEKALAAMVGQVLQLVGQAAQKSGAKVSMQTGSAALKEIVTVMVSMLASAGKVQDVQRSVQAIMQMIMSGGQQQEPVSQQPQEQPAMGV